MDIILLFLIKPLDKYGITLVYITHLPLLSYTEPKVTEDVERSQISKRNNYR